MVISWWYHPLLLSSHNRPDGDFVVHSRLSETAKNKSEARFSIIELKLDKSQSDTHTPKEREERKKRRERKKEKLKGHHYFL